MTFTVTIINDHGVWQSSDFRLLDPSNGTCADEFSIKQMDFVCKDGCFSITYAGVGRVFDIHLTDWMRKLTRGESRTVDETLVMIRESATQDLAPVLLKARPRPIEHAFCIGAFVAGTPWAVNIVNSRMDGIVLPHFETIGQRVPQGLGGFMAWPRYASDKDMALLQRLCGKKPRKSHEFFEILARVNRRVSSRNVSRGSVSEHCVTTFMPPAGHGMQTKYHYMPKNAPSITKPVQLFGIDLTEMLSSSPFDENFDVDAASKASVTPENQLSKRLGAGRPKGASMITTTVDVQVF